MRVGRLFRQFLASEKGNIALLGAVLIPLLVVGAAAGIDIASAEGERSRLLSIAQAAALTGASDLGLAAGDRMAVERSRSWAETEIGNWRGPLRATVTSTIIERERGGRAIQVAIDANRESLFGRILPPGGWNISVRAVAAPSSTVPLCVIATHVRTKKTMNVKDRGLLRAPSCAVHSNNDITVANNGRIEASLITAVRAVTGNVSGLSVPDAPVIADPFADLDLNPPACSSNGVIEYSSGTHTLAAGVHCDDIKLSGTAILQLSRGEHWFVDADFEAKDNARVEGDDVVLLFDKKSKFKFDDLAMVRLTGREEGRLSGFVLIATRDNNHDFIITSENVDSLLGVIYVPSAQFVIDGNAEVARQSAWTVIVARSIELKGNPELFVNANYRTSDVPVPEGVGPRASSPRLIE